MRRRSVSKYPCGMLFISGATPSPLYHKHPHVLEEHEHPNSIEEQTHRAMKTIQSILDHEGLAWTDIVKVTKYLTDIRDQDGMVKVMKEYFGDWTPASTTICINQLSTQGARVELDMIAAIPCGEIASFASFSLAAEATQPPGRRPAF